MQRSLVDTDILSELLKLRNATVQARAVAYIQEHRRITISAITRYDVLRGFIARKASAQIERFSVFCHACEVRNLDQAIFDRAAELWATARERGRSANDADLLIAATAIEHGSVLVTGNTANFEWIDGITLDDWRK